MDNGIPVLERLDHAADEALGPLGRGVDGDESKGAFRGGHFELSDLYIVVVCQEKLGLLE
jgi:hypothetical protein